MIPVEVSADCDGGCAPPDPARVADFIARFQARQLVSLWEMLRAYAHNFVKLSSQLRGLAETCKQTERAELSLVFVPALSAVLNEQLDELLAECTALELEGVPAKIERVRGYLSAGRKMSDAVQQLKDLRERIADALIDRQFLYVPSSLSPYYTSPMAGWRDVPNKFPSAAFDIAEAGKCLALGRGTACVFHLMRVMEVGLKVTAAGLGIPYAPSWESYIKQIVAKVAPNWKDKTPEWKGDEPFYKEISGGLQAIRIAWRNPTMHVVNTYTPEEASNIYNAVRSFMGNLATKLEEAV